MQQGKDDKETVERSWDHSSSDEFYDYYAEQSVSAEGMARATRTRDLVLRLRGHDEAAEPLKVLDVGCNAGTFSMLWAEQGHDVIGVDINERLIELAKERAAAAGARVDFRVGSATDLPIESESVDVCLSPELLEHVAEWESCLDEFARVLKPNGTLFLTTTNKLCPSQMEFNLPLYSWYPGFAKRYFERLAVTTRPSLANYATYPAVNWFSFYGLRDELEKRGMSSLDRFDVMNLESASALKIGIVAVIRRFALIRWLAHVCTPSSIVVATKLEMAR